MSIWGAWVPVGTPEPIIEKLSGALAEAVGDPKVDASLGELGFLTVGSSPAEYGERVVTEMERWAEVIEAAGIEVD
jgi:tripartite-type tricarboxylate transporter receptor subunit TctC